MLPQECIRLKRLGERLSPDAITCFCEGVGSGAWSEGQIAAMAMAICCRGMDTDERVGLTLAMRDSGRVFRWEDEGLDGPVLDKHSTGGVGDGVSLVLGPLLAACGAHVPMISGRGLGHTGGTLDKLEAILGYQVQPNETRFRETVRDVGVAIVGASEEIAPADARLYAVRDLTDTVASIDLIMASILSKKLAAGLGGLVMDVKVGNGAFLPDHASARALAEALVRVAEGAGMPTRAVLTNMNQSLSGCAGNALEVAHALRCLRADERRESPFLEVVMALGAQALLLGSLASDEANARRQLKTALESGQALERFQRMLTALGSPHDFIDRPHAFLEEAPVQIDVPAPRGGFVSDVNTRELGMIVVRLGGGRSHPGQTIDHAVGLTGLVSCGQAVDAGFPLGRIHARDETAASEASRALLTAIALAEEAPDLAPTVLEVFH